MARVLIIGDTHLFYEHPMYRRFCRDLRDTHRCDTVVHIGDVIDSHAISNHEKNPSAPGASDEYEKTRERLADWVRTFPKVKVCIGNHDARVARIAATVNIPEVFLKSFKELWKTPNWDWQKQHIIDDVLYIHGTGFGGLHPAYNAMTKMLMSVVMGHIHTAAGISWKANPQQRIFGMSVGTGIDDKALAFSYAEHNPLRSIVSAATVIDGVPYHHIMSMGPKERYHRSRAK